MTIINLKNRSQLILHIIVCLILLGILIHPNAVFAQNEGPSGPGSGVELFENPLGPIKDIQTLIDKILGIVVKVGLPIVAISIIYVGFLFVIARGSDEKLKQAKEAFVYTMIGGAIVLGAFVISKAIKATVDEIKKESTFVPGYIINVAWAQGPGDPAGGAGVPPAPANPDAIDNSTIASIIYTVLINNVFKAFGFMLFGFAAGFFVFSVAKYVTKGGDDEERAKFRQLVFYGILALGIMVSVWGFVGLVSRTFFPDGPPTTYPLPKLP